MLTIRLSRTGRKKMPMYRIMVQEKGRDPWGTHLEIIGHINPHTTPTTMVVDAERAQYWISKGADPSDTVWNMFVDHGIVKGEKRRNSTISKKRQKAMDDDKAKEAEKVAAAKAKAEAEAEAAKAAAEAAKQAEIEAAAAAKAVAEAPAAESVEEPVAEVSTEDVATAEETTEQTA